MASLDSAVKTVPISSEYHVECFDPRVAIGRGSSGAMLPCVRLADGALCVVKFIRYGSEGFRELSLWRMCAHPHVVPLLDVFDSGPLLAGHALLGSDSDDLDDGVDAISTTRAPGRYLLAVMPAMEGGDLVDVLAGGVLNETDAASIISQLVMALAHIHARGVVHGDVKAENILLQRPLADGPAHVFLCDFGFARNYYDEPCPRGMQFTRSVVAPETIASFIAKGRGGSFLPVGPSSDMWAVGVVAFLLVTHEPPFCAVRGEPGWDDGRTLTPLMRDCIVDADYDMDALMHATSDARDFVQSLLVASGVQRPSVERVRTHPWLHVAPIDLCRRAGVWNLMGSAHCLTS